MNIANWIKQPTTIGGFATLLGTATAVLAGQMTWQAAIPVVVAGIVAMALPDNTAAAANAKAAATDLEALAQAMVNAKKTNL
jgi:hypothetical protein